MPKWPDNAYGNKHPIEQMKKIKYIKCWHDLIWEPGPSRQIPDEPASQMPGNFPDTNIKQLCHKGEAALAAFFMSKAIPHKADSTESKPLREWTYKDIQTLPAAAQEEWKATCRCKLKMLCEHKVYELVNLPKGQKVISN